MKNLYQSLILSLTLFCSQIIQSAEMGDNYKGTWSGVEVIGVDRITAQKVRDLMPFHVGDAFVTDKREYYRSTCTSLIKDKLSLDASCVNLMFGDGKVYLTVDIIPESSKKTVFRKIPNKGKSVARLPQELQILFEKWEARMSYLLSVGNFPMEIYDKDYLDYEDPILHSLSEQLSQHAWKHNDILLDIVHYAQEPEERRKAAILFAWSRHPENLAVILEWDLLADPDSGVRNYVARSYIDLIDRIKDKKLLTNLLPAYCKQASFPQHTDRNKALFSIREILTANPDLATSISPECKDTITYISEMSILNNVGDIATDILKIMENSTHA